MRAPIVHQHWHPQVLQLSALKSQGLDRFWNAISDFRATQLANGQLAERRRHQSLAWMWERIESGLRQAFRNDPNVRQLLPHVTAQVEAGRLAASTAARQLLQAAG